MSRTFKKVLVANRGEIAIRIFRACHDLGIHTVAIYSNEDTYSLFRTKADEAYLVGEKKSPLGAYLDIPGIIGLAKRRGVTAIHPGYGFLSENADFARACEENGILFIGPSAKVLGQMGDKLSAKEIALACGVPIIPGCTEPLRDAEDAVEKAVSFGFPVILKAAAGGGGRGMRRCDSPEEVRTAYELVHSEAEKAFGCGDIFMEKYLVEPKHIEVQILADEDFTVYNGVSQTILSGSLTVVDGKAVALADVAGPRGSQRMARLSIYRAVCDRRPDGARAASGGEILSGV